MLYNDYKQENDKHEQNGTGQYNIHEAKPISRVSPPTEFTTLTLIKTVELPKQLFYATNKVVL